MKYHLYKHQMRSVDHLYEWLNRLEMTEVFFGEYPHREKARLILKMVSLHDCGYMFKMYFTHPKKI